MNKYTVRFTCGKIETITADNVRIDTVNHLTTIEFLRGQTIVLKYKMNQITSLVVE